jgi:hypothetical protein
VTATTRTISRRALRTLGCGLESRVILPGDPHYDRARRVYNAMVDKWPAAIVRCAGADDVARGIRLARELALPLAVRGSGHNAAGHAVCDGGIVVDVAALKRVEIDTRARRVKIGAGLTWAELDRATQQFGLAIPGGTVSSTGVSGLTLGGGIGWLMGPCGLTCDNLVGAELITAAGDVVEADEELLWALRGGGGNFGVVTSFTFALHEVDTVLAGALVIPFGEARAALATLRELNRGVPDELTVCPTFVTAASGDRLLSVDVCFAGDLQAGERVVRRLAARLAPSENTVRPQPYLRWQKYLDPMFDTPMRGYWKTCFLDRLDDDGIDRIASFYAKAPSARSTLILEHFHGAMTRVGADYSAFGHRDKPYSLLITARWEDPAHDLANVAWANALYAAMRPFSDGSGYLNYMGVEREDVVRRSYGEANYRRLVAVKNRIDPDNVFRHNQNIRPSRRATRRPERCP